MISSNPFKFSWQHATGVRKKLILALVIFVIAYVILAFRSYAIKLVFDGLENLDQQAAYLALMIFAGIHIIGSILRGSYAYLATSCYGKMTQEVLQFTTAYLRHHSSDFYNRRIAGKIANDAISMRETTDIFFNSLESLVEPLIRLIISLGLAVYVNIYLGTLMLLWAAIMFFYTKREIFKLNRVSLQRTKLLSKTSGMIADLFSNFNIARLFNTKHIELQRLNKQLHRNYHKDVAYRSIRVKLRAIINLADASLRVLIMCLAAYFYLHAQITLGDITLFLGVWTNIEIATNNLVNFLRDFDKNFSSLQHSIREIFVPQADLDPPGAVILKSAHPTISFRKMDFAYDGKKAIQKLSLNIAQGEKVGLVGASGAGSAGPSLRALRGSTALQPLPLHSLAHASRSDHSLV